MGAHIRRVPIIGALTLKVGNVMTCYDLLHIPILRIVFSNTLHTTRKLFYLLTCFTYTYCAILCVGISGAIDFGGVEMWASYLIIKLMCCCDNICYFKSVTLCCQRYCYTLVKFQAFYINAFYARSWIHEIQKRSTSNTVYELYISNSFTELAFKPICANLTSTRTFALSIFTHVR